MPSRRVLPLVGRLVALTAVLAALLLVVAGPAQADDATPPGKAWVRAGHLTPGVGATRIDLVPASGASTSVVMSPSASYGDVTAYQKVDPGDYTVFVRPQGAALETAPMLQRAFTVVAGKATTLAVVGTADSPRLVVLDDDLTLPAASSARVRILPAASSAQTVSVVAQNGPTLTTGAILGQATGYASVPAGSWTLDLTSGGGPTAVQTVDLMSGSVYTAIVLDAANGSVNIKVVTDAAGATTAPQGAAQTGGGAMAAAVAGDDEAGFPPLAGWGLAAAAGSALVLASGKRRTGAAGPGSERTGRR
ncbi:MAG: DUF4397 domain-containing protein [Lapillicoccus sp.]